MELGLHCDACTTMLYRKTQGDYQSRYYSLCCNPSRRLRLFGQDRDTTACQIGLNTCRTHALSLTFENGLISLLSEARLLSPKETVVDMICL